MFEVVGRLLDLVLMKHVAVGHGALSAVRPDQVEYRLDALQVHGDAFQAIGNLAGHWSAFQAADLLEIGELGDLHAIQPDLPAEAPGPQRG